MWSIKLLPTLFLTVMFQVLYVNSILTTSHPLPINSRSNARSSLSLFRALQAPAHSWDILQLRIITKSLVACSSLQALERMTFRFVASKLSNSLTLSWRSADELRKFCSLLSLRGTTKCYKVWFIPPLLMGIFYDKVWVYGRKDVKMFCKIEVVRHEATETFYMTQKHF